MTTQSQWQPQKEQLQQLAGYLVESLSGKNPTTQKKAELVSVRSCVSRTF